MNEQQMLSPVVAGKKMLWIYNLVEKDSKDGGKKTIWNKVGTAFVNRDGSLNLILDAIPLSGRCQVREDRDPPEWRTRGALASRADAEA
jgi:hypothetical protein